MTTIRTTWKRGRTDPVQYSLSHTSGPCIPVPENLAKRCICYMLGQLAILQHPDDVQSFDIDRLVLADDLGREFSESYLYGRR